MKKILFSPPDIRTSDIKAVCKALKSGWITTGPTTKKFEDEICKFLGAKKAVCLNSQTACAELTLRLLGIGPGDEVIVPAYTYTATCSVVLHVGATPVIIDSQKDSLEMDYDLVEKAISRKTKAIIPVDIAGIPCDYDKIFSLVEKYRSIFEPSNELQKSIGRIVVMADTAHSFGAQYKGKMCGQVADFSNFSFHAVKNLTTAEGGAVTWNNNLKLDDEIIYKEYQLLSLHGQNKDALAKTKLGAWRYDIVGPYYKCNLTDIASALGLSQLKRYKKTLIRRLEIVHKYDNFLSKFNVKLLQHYSDDRKSSCHLYFVKLPCSDESLRNKFIEEMGLLGVACNVHYQPLPMLSAYKNLGFKISNYPNANNHYKSEITLPLHTKLTNKEVNYVLACFKKVYEKLFLIN